MPIRSASPWATSRASRRGRRRRTRGSGDRTAGPPARAGRRSPVRAHPAEVAVEGEVGVRPRYPKPAVALLVMPRALRSTNRTRVRPQRTPSAPDAWSRATNRAELDERDLRAAWPIRMAADTRIQRPERPYRICPWPGRTRPSGSRRRGGRNCATVGSAPHPMAGGLDALGPADLTEAPPEHQAVPSTHHDAHPEGVARHRGAEHGSPERSTEQRQGDRQVTGAEEVRQHQPFAATPLVLSRLRIQWQGGRSEEGGLPEGGSPFLPVMGVGGVCRLRSALSLCGFLSLGKPEWGGNSHDLRFPIVGRFRTQCDPSDTPGGRRWDIRRSTGERRQAPRCRAVADEACRIT